MNFVIYDKMNTYPDKQQKAYIKKKNKQEILDPLKQIYCYKGKMMSI